MSTSNQKALTEKVSSLWEILSEASSFASDLSQQVEDAESVGALLRASDFARDAAEELKPLL
jgi:hypothetical protein